VTEERLNVAGLADAARRRDPWWGMHASRYLFARKYPGRRVLDIACGTGYGLRLLAEGAGRVVGVDADAGTARTARLEAGDRASVLVGDGGRLPFGDGTFDLVTSFETIEHLRDRRGFVDELRRVLAPGGICVISTPNALYTEPVDGVPKNRFHVHEYEPDEFVAELSPSFGAIELVGQQLSARFVMSPFWDDQQRLPPTAAVRARLAVWRLVNRLPGGARDAASRALWGHDFIPTEHDYRFEPDTTPGVPVLVAICRP
jgi:SAM-dependent methyltransferase